jgi:hypothetical protein
VYDVAQVNQHLSEYSTTFRLTTYNNSLLGKDAVSLKEKVTCVDEHQKDVGLGHTTYTPAIKDCYTQNQFKAHKMAEDLLRNVSLETLSEDLEEEHHL